MIILTWIRFNLNLIFKQIRNEINSNEALSHEETQEIIDNVNKIEEISKSDSSKKEKWSKLRGCLSWLGTKGVDLGVKILPVILTILKDSE